MRSQSSYSDNVTISTIRRRADAETARGDGETWLNIHPEYQREYEAWTAKLKSRLIESILLGRSMNPVWTVFNESEDSEEVLDGMHRLTTALDFFNNQFPLAGNVLMELDPTQYDGKCFQDFPKEEQQRFRDYKFHFNKLDSSYRKNPQKLLDMYEILNRSSKPLNTYEFNKILFLDFYTALDAYVPGFRGSVLFQKEKSRRGAIKTKMIEALSTCEEQLPSSFSGLTKLSEKWLQGFGEEAASIQGAIQARLEDITRRMEEILYVMQKYTESSLFDTAFGTISRNIESLFVISRSVCYFRFDRSLFNRHLPSLVTTFRETLFGEEKKTDDKINRDGRFQRRLVTQIDAIITAEIGEPEPRCFPTKMIQARLAEQGGKCAICSLPISDKDRYEGDHIVPWSQKGRTVPENLQVVHRACHKAK